jgi:hypothetical protein
MLKTIVGVVGAAVVTLGLATAATAQPSPPPGTMAGRPPMAMHHHWRHHRICRWHRHHRHCWWRRW